jgi:dihydroneopterin aldolase
MSLAGVKVPNMKVGINPRELAPGFTQTLIFDIDLISHKGAFTGASIADCVDYDRVLHYVLKLPQRPHIDLLETILEELVQFCFEDKNVDACRVKVSKPDIYNGNPVPSVTFFRNKSA